MKRLLCGAIVALSLALPTAVHADCSFEYSCSRHLCFQRTSKNRCFSYSSYSNPLACAAGCCPTGPAMWNGLAAYGYPGYGYPAPVAATPVAAAPVVAAPAATSPSFKAPQPAPASSSSTGVQQTGYFYYGQPTATPNYGATGGYNYYGTNYGYGSYGYGSYGYAQAPNYWY